jgi:hypothetical protein
VRLSFGFGPFGVYSGGRRPMRQPDANVLVLPTMVMLPVGIIFALLGSH